MDQQVSRRPARAVDGARKSTCRRQGAVDGARTSTGRSRALRGSRAGCSICTQRPREARRQAEGLPHRRLCSPGDQRVAGGAGPMHPRRRHNLLRPQAWALCAAGEEAGGVARRCGRTPRLCRVAVDVGPRGVRAVASRPGCPAARRDVRQRVRGPGAAGGAPSDVRAACAPQQPVAPE
jgi:hypothetical protein